MLPPLPPLCTYPTPQAPRASAPGALPATNGYPSAAANPLRSSHAGSVVPYGSLAAADGPPDSYKADPRASSLLCLPARKSGKFSFRLPSRQGSRSVAPHVCPYRDAAGPSCTAKAFMLQALVSSVAPM